MATTTLTVSHSHSQGLIKYVKDASQVSRDNIFLRELGNAANLKRKLRELLEDLTVAQARAMLVEWIEADNHGHHQPSKIPQLQKLPARLSRVETETFPLGSFFGDREKASMIRQSQTRPEQKQWTMYFEAWGCLVCQRRDVPHAANGMCHNCRMRIYGRLKRLRHQGRRILPYSRETAVGAHDHPSAPR